MQRRSGKHNPEYETLEKSEIDCKIANANPKIVVLIDDLGKKLYWPLSNVLGSNFNIL